MPARSAILVVLAALLAGCGGPAKFRSSPDPDAREVPGSRSGSGVRDAVTAQKGKASYYHDSLHGNRTASGERYDRNAMTAAHKTLPFGTEIRVTNHRNGKSVRLRINDRGPFVDGRIVDVSRRAAEKLAFVREGVVDVTVEVLD